jgi:hypothetical protein
MSIIGGSFLIGIVEKSGEQEIEVRVFEKNDFLMVYKNLRTDDPAPRSAPDTFPN